MNNNITFIVEKVFGPDKQVKGFFVSKSDVLPSANPIKDVFATMAAVMGEQVGEGYKKPKEPEKLFCATPKEVQDWITYELGEFTGK